MDSLISDNLSRFQNLNYDWLKIEGSYESDYWYLQDLNIIYNRKICFIILSEDKNKVLRKQYVETLKSWCISLIEHNYSIEEIANKISTIIQAIELSSYFNPKHLEEFEINFFNKNLKNTTHLKKAINFINFNNYTDIDIHSEYIEIIYEHYFKNSNKKSNIRTLPKSKDVIKFAMIVENFFECNINNSIFIKFFPIYLWWNLTNIIPLRITEFCLIKSDALKIIENHYYLQIPRGKLRYNRELGYTSILIPEKIAKKIIEYKEKIKEIDVIDESSTLISYYATTYDYDLNKIKRHKLRNNDYYLKNQFKLCLDKFYVSP